MLRSFEVTGTVHVIRGGSPHVLKLQGRLTQPALEEHSPSGRSAIAHVDDIGCISEDRTYRISHTTNGLTGALDKVQ